MLYLIIIIDQLIKYFAYINKPNKIIIKNFLEIIYSENTGTVFGTFQNTNAIFAIISLIIILLLIYFIKRYAKPKSAKRYLLSIILAGGIGNLIDRVIRGFVIDYLYIRPFGICNLADICITVGVFLLLIYEISFEKRKKVK